MDGLVFGLQVLAGMVAGLVSIALVLELLDRTLGAAARDERFNRDQELWRRAHERERTVTETPRASDLVKANESEAAMEERNRASTAEHEAERARLAQVPIIAVSDTHVSLADGRVVELRSQN